MTGRSCTVDGCERPHYAKELCNPHYLQVRRHGRVVAAHVRDADPVERFRTRYYLDEVTGCWRWTRKTLRTGYGVLSVDGRQVLAHRFSYELHVGPIPDGLQIDHVHARGCRYRDCVNPDHLEPVTQAENVRRAAAVVTSCPAGHPYDAANTYWRKDRPGTRQCKACARDRRRAA